MQQITYQWDAAQVWAEPNHVDIAAGDGRSISVRQMTKFAFYPFTQRKYPR